MEKLFKSMMAVAIAAFTFAACDDVPEPYNNPYNGIVIVPEVQDADPEGAGTKEDPFNVAAALAKCKEVGETASSDEFYCKGYVTSITEISAQYGNATFKIADSKEGGTELTVYRAKGPGKADVKDENLVKLGDEVVICGKLVNFKSNTPEFTTGCYIVSINGKGSSEEPTGETIGTKEAPITVAKALEEINKLENGKTTSSEAYVKGKISKVDRFNDQYKSITYYISDDGTETNQLQVYSGKGLNGADFAAITDLSVGQEVIVLGKLKKYVKDDNVTPEIDQSSKIISINGEGGTPTPTPTGDNLLVNGDFETWEGSTPTNWNGVAQTANSVSKSSDAHSGNYSLKLIGASQNKRMSSMPVALKAGTYNIKFYAKGVEKTAKIAPGYCKIGDDGKVVTGSYTYISTYPEVSTTWTEVTYSFTLDQQTKVCLIVMNHSSTAADVLIDDYELTTSDGGIADGGDGGGSTPSGDAYTKVTSIADGNYIIAACTEGTSYVVASPVAADKTYGYLNKTDVTETSGSITADAANEFTIKAVTGGYTIQDASGRYYYNGSGNKNYSVTDTATDDCKWNITFDADGHAIIKSVSTNGIMYYSTQYNSYGCYTDTQDAYRLPFLLKK